MVIKNNVNLKRYILQSATSEKNPNSVFIEFLTTEFVRLGRDTFL